MCSRKGPAFALYRTEGSGTRPGTNRKHRLRVPFSNWRISDGVSGQPGDLCRHLCCGVLPTYVLPYFGSNSMAAHLVTTAASAAVGRSGQAFLLPFYLHLLCPLALCALAYLRGTRVNRTWLLVFPFLALVFDLVPVLTWIPLVPTAMHLLTIILGVAGVQPVASLPIEARVGTM